MTDSTRRPALEAKAREAAEKALNEGMYYFKSDFKENLILLLADFASSYAAARVDEALETAAKKQADEIVFHDCPILPTNGESLCAFTKERLTRLLIDFARAREDAMIEQAARKMKTNREACEYAIPRHNPDDPAAKEFDIMRRVYLMAEEEIRALIEKTHEGKDGEQ